MKPEERIDETKDFLRFASQIWPNKRKQFGKQISSRCAKCVLSDQCTVLENGLCPLCKESSTLETSDNSSNIAAMSSSLDEILDSHQETANGQYDALVMFSGGKDSTMLLHELRKQYSRLRILAVMIDNGFTSPIALQNVRRVSDVINDVDHLIHKPKASLFRNTFRYALTHLGSGGCYSSVDRLAGDLALDICRNLAAAAAIPLLIHGGTRAQVQRILKLSSFETPRNLEKQKRETIANFKLSEIYSDEEMRYWWDGSLWDEDRVPRVIFPHYVWEYDEQEVRREVVKLGLLAEGNDNPIASNYDLLPLNFAVDVNHLGFTSYEPEFSQLIREGKTNREHWLNIFESIEYLARKGMLLPRCIDDTLGKLQMSHTELHLPPPSTEPLPS